MLRLVLAVSLVLFSLNLRASPLTDTLLRLVETGHPREAYQQALPHRDELAGTAAFDFPFGMAAIDSGDINEGVFALERVLLLNPEHHRARLEYARGLFLLGDNGPARREFNRVAAQPDLPAAVRGKIAFFLQAIEDRESRYQPSASGFVQLGVGYDDNINSAPSDQLQLITLDQASLGQGDRFGTLRAGAELRLPTTRSSRYYGRWDSTLRRYAEETSFSHDNHSLTLGRQWGAPSSRVDLNLNIQRYRLDDAGYRTLIGPGISWARALSSDLLLQTGGSLQFMDYPRADHRNGRQGIVYARLLGAVAARWSPSWFVGAFYGDERSDDQSADSRGSVDRRFRGLQGGGQLDFRPDLSLSAGIVYQHSGYDAVFNSLPYKLSGVIRSDDYTAANLALKHKLSRDWTLDLGLNYSRSRSNIELYQYRRKQVDLSLRYDF